MGRVRRRAATCAATCVAALLLPLAGAWLAGCSGEQTSISIVSPEEGATVPAGEPIAIRVQINGGHIQGTDGEGRPGHLHLYVDRELVEMASETQPVLTLEPGTHEIMVEFAGEQHQALGITDRVDVTAR